MGKRFASWDDAKKGLLGHRGADLFRQLKACNPSEVPVRRLAALRKMLAEDKHLDPKRLDSMSLAAAALCRWLCALSDAAPEV